MQPLTLLLGPKPAQIMLFVMLKNCAARAQGEDGARGSLASCSMLGLGAVTDKVPQPIKQL